MWRIPACASILHGTQIHPPAYYMAVSISFSGLSILGPGNQKACGYASEKRSSLIRLYCTCTSSAFACDPCLPAYLPACLCHIHGPSLHPYRCRRRHSGAIRMSINSTSFSACCKYFRFSISVDVYVRCTWTIVTVSVRSVE